MLDLFYPTRSDFLLAVRAARKYSGIRAYPLAAVLRDYATVGQNRAIVARSMI